MSSHTVSAFGKETTTENYRRHKDSESEGRMNVLPTPDPMNIWGGECGQWQCVKGDPKDLVPIPYHQSFENTTHGVLQVQGPVSPAPERIQVNVFDGSNGKHVSVKMRNTDTIKKLQQRFLKVRPDLGGTVNFAYNGKPLQLHQTLVELQVKPGATFITYQRCHGG